MPFPTYTGRGVTADRVVKIVAPVRREALNAADHVAEALGSRGDADPDPGRGNRQEEVRVGAAAQRLLTCERIISDSMKGDHELP